MLCFSLSSLVSSLFFLVYSTLVLDLLPHARSQVTTETSQALATTFAPDTNLVKDHGFEMHLGQAGGGELGSRRMLLSRIRPGFTPQRKQTPKTTTGTKVHVMKPKISGAHSTMLVRHSEKGYAIKDGVTQVVKDIHSVTLYWDRNMDDSNIKSALKAWNTFFKQREEDSKGMLSYSNADYDNYKKADVAVIFASYNRHKSSTEYRRRLWKKQLHAGGRVLTIELGFFRRDDGFFSASWDTGIGPDFCGVHFPYSGITQNVFAYNKSWSRWRDLKMDDPKEYEPPEDPEHPGPIVFLGQVAWDSQTQKLTDYWSWLWGTLKLIRLRTDLPVIYRPHPKVVLKGNDKTCYKWKDHEEIMPCLDPNVTGVELDMESSLKELISKASVVVTYNSNSLMDVILAGKPAIAISLCTPVKELVMHEITRQNLNHPRIPKHDVVKQAVFNLVYYQWNLDEIRSGEAWDSMRIFLGHYKNQM